jgi:hypothetical protein
MDDLEEQLRRAFAPQLPPEGFADRVIARAGAGPRIISGRHSVPRWLAAAAAVLAIVAGGGYGYRQRQGEIAKREVLLAFRIASVKLSHIQTQVSK